jgi:hypothetical protein
MNINARFGLLLGFALVCLLQGQVFAESSFISEAEQFEPRKAARQLVDAISSVYQESDEADPQEVDRKAHAVLSELLQGLYPSIKNASDKARDIFNVEFPTLMAEVSQRRSEELEREIQKETNSTTRARQQSLLEYFRKQHESAVRLAKNLRLKYESQGRL